MHFYFRNVINRKIQADLINFPPPSEKFILFAIIRTSPWPCESCLSAGAVKQDLLRQIKHWEKLGIK